MPIKERTVVTARKEPPPSGTNEFELLVADKSREVSFRDVLEVTTSNRPADERGKGSRTIYLGPSHGDKYPGVILFYLDEPNENAPRLVTPQRGLTSWKRVGVATEEEWELLKREVARKDATERTVIR